MRLLIACLVCLASVCSTLTELRGESLPLYIGIGGDSICRTQFHTRSLGEPVKVSDTVRRTFLWIHDATDWLESISEQRCGIGADGP